MNMVCEKNKCAGCMACVDICPKQAISVLDDMEHMNAIIDTNLCVQETMLDIKKKFGKNAVLKGTNYLDGATMRERNGQIGGHKAK